MKKVAVSGGAAVTLCDAPSGRGGSWADDGSIVFQPESTPGNSLMRVSAAGGTPSPLHSPGRRRSDAALAPNAPGLESRALYEPRDRGQRI